MLLNLIGLGFVLSLDNFRTAIILGPLRFTRPHALKIAVVFGFFDGVAPLAGILLGHDVSQKIGGVEPGQRDRRGGSRHDGHVPIGSSRTIRRHHHIDDSRWPAARASYFSHNSRSPTLGCRGRRGTHYRGLRTYILAIIWELTSTLPDDLG